MLPVLLSYLFVKNNKINLQGTIFSNEQSKTQYSPIRSILIWSSANTQYNFEIWSIIFYCHQTSKNNLKYFILKKITIFVLHSILSFYITFIYFITNNVFKVLDLWIMSFYKFDFLHLHILFIFLTLLLILSIDSFSNIF